MKNLSLAILIALSLTACGGDDAETNDDDDDGGDETPASSVPTAPIAYEPGTIFTLDSGTTNYVFVPTSYDDSHQTPTKLFVWMHGCGGFSQYDIANVSPEYNGGAQSWISIAPGGAENGCWDVNAAQDTVRTAIADMKTHFNIDPKRVVLGGYSSGGDLSYRLAFYHANEFAGIAVMNTTPFRDTGSTQSASLAAATRKFNVHHVAHLQDTVYPYVDFSIGGNDYTGIVERELDAMVSDGFPVERTTLEGDHFNYENSASALGNIVPGTDADIRTYLLPNIEAGWAVP